MTLTEEERSLLLRWARRASSPQALALRSKIVLKAAGGVSNKQIAADLGTSVVTVGKWRRRFLEHRLAGLADEDRPGRPVSVTVDQVEQVLTATLEQMPPDARHWSRTSMARRTGLSPSTIGRIWREFNLKPHRTETFKLSTDPDFVAKVVDVVGLYHNPPEKAVVLCLGEKAQVQVVNQSRPILPMNPGTIERRTHDNVRHGTTTLSAAFNIAAGTAIGQTQRRHRSAEFERFLARIDMTVPPSLDIHLVVDNYAAHKTPENVDARSLTFRIGAADRTRAAIHTGHRLASRRVSARLIPGQALRPGFDHPHITMLLQRRAVLTFPIPS